MKTKLASYNAIYWEIARHIRVPVDKVAAMVTRVTRRRSKRRSKRSGKVHNARHALLTRSRLHWKALPPGPDISHSELRKQVKQSVREWADYNGNTH